MGRFRTFGRKIWGLAVKAFADELPTQAAALAFYSALSLAPLVLLTLAALSTIGLDLQGQFLREVDQLMGGGAALTMRSILDYADSHPQFVHSANLFGVIALAVAASGIFAQLQTALNKIFCCPPATHRSDIVNYLLHRLVALSVVLIFIFVSIASLALTTFLTLLVEPRMAFIGQWIHFAATFAVFSLIFTALFKWMPDKDVSWRDAWIGGVSTSVLFQIGKFIITYYLERGGYDAAYGAAGSLVVLLLWVYYSSFTIFLGAEIASVRDENQPGLQT